MTRIDKKVVVLYNDNKPVKCMEIKDITTIEELANLQKECSSNLAQIKLDYQAKEIELKSKIQELEKRLARCETEIKYDHGEITDEEYETLCGNK